MLFAYLWVAKKGVFSIKPKEDMKLKADVPEIDQDEPFKNCKLNRGETGKRLKKFVYFTDGGFVMSINNKWGAGKTTFIKMWAQLMANDGYKTLYLNAWENDFDNSPFISLLSELDSISGDQIALYKLQKTARRLIPKGWRNIASGVANHLTGVDINELEKEIIKGTSDSLRKEMTEYRNKKDALDDFKAELWAYIKSSCGGKPLIFIVDELDRCRPDYAVELLEKIKHLFAVNNIVFILCIDKEQLGYAIQGRYGSSNINTEEYLRRFINYEFTLPAPKINDYFNYLFIQTFGGTGKRPNGKWITLFKDLPIISLMTLRQLESFFFVLGNCNNIIGTHEEYTIYSLLTLISLKILKNNDYNNIKNLNYSVEEFQKKIATLFLLSGKRYNKVEANHILNIEAILCSYYSQKRSHNILYEHIRTDGELLDKYLPRNSEIIGLTEVQGIDPKRFNELIEFYLHKNGAKIDFLDVIEDLADVQVYTNPVEVTVEKL